VNPRNKAYYVVLLIQLAGLTGDYVTTNLCHRYFDRPSISTDIHETNPRTEAILDHPSWHISYFAFITYSFFYMYVIYRLDKLPLLGRDASLKTLAVSFILIMILFSGLVKLSLASSNLMWLYRYGFFSKMVC
jgi:hypothetical protein